MPGIVGNFFTISSIQRGFAADNPFHVNYENKYTKDDNNSGAWYESTIHFDAARANSIYGNSATVTPLSLKTQYYIKA